MTGAQLRKRREAASLKAWEVGAKMRVSSSRVSQIEALAAVTDETTARYLAAIQECLVVTTASQTPAEAA